MKRTMINGIVSLSIIITMGAFGQGFIEPIENVYYLKGNACTLRLESGEEIQGTFAGGSYSANGLSKIKIDLENGEEAKFIAEQVISLRIKTSESAKLSMITSSSSSIVEMANSNYDEIINREYIIFETALMDKKNETRRLMQLSNPGFDSKIKVFAEPGKQTAGMGVGSVTVSGGEARAYLFVKGKDISEEVNKGSYSKNFETLYSDCPKMLDTFKGDKISWEDIALHVYYYDKFCK